MSQEQNTGDRDLHDAVRAIVESKRPHIESPPGPEELLDYLDGELDEERASAVRERLSLHPEAARIALDLVEPAQEPPADFFDAKSCFRRTHRALRAAGHIGKPTAITRWWTPRAHGVHPGWRWVTVALLVLSVGLTLRLAFPSRDPMAAAPLTDVTHWVLRSDRAHQPRSLDSELGSIRAGTTRWHVLILVVDDPERFERFQAEIVTEQGQQVHSLDGLGLSSIGTIDFLVPAEEMVDGRYRIELYGVDPSSRELLATYALRWD